LQYGSHLRSDCRPDGLLLHIEFDEHGAVAVRATQGTEIEGEAMNHRTGRNIFSGIAAAVLSILTAQVTAGQEVDAGESARKTTAILEAVIVTARYREESLLKMGMAISAFSGDELERGGINDFNEIILRSPGLDSANRGPNKNDISIRGLANANAINDFSRRNPLVGVYMDGVPIATPFNSQRGWNLFDLARVEVVRGPQGTLYGEGAMGGAIRYITNDPVLDRFEGKLKTSISSTKDSGELNRDVYATINVPIVDERFGARITGFYRYDDGFIDLPVVGENNANDYESAGVRIVTVGNITDALQLRLSATYEDNKLGSEWIVTGDADDLISANPLLEPVDDEALLLTGQITYETTYGTFTSITGYLDRDQDESGYDWLTTAGFGGLTTKSYVLGNEQFTQEFRFASQFEGPLNFMVGAYYKDLDSVQDLFVWTDIGLPEFVPSGDQEESYKGKHYSGFGEVTWDVRDNLRLTAGVRYFREDVKATQTWTATTLSPFPPTETRVIDLPIREWLPKFGVEYSPTENWLIYGAAGRGARNGSTSDTTTLVFLEAGGFDTTSISTYGPDSAWSYEVGFKGVALNNRLTANLALYYTDWSDIQGVVLTPPIVLFGGFQFGITSNLEAAESKGAELFVEFQATDALSLFFNGNVTDAEISEDSVFDPATGTVIPEGSEIPNVPEYSLSTGGEYVYSLGTFFGREATFVAHVDYQYVADRKRGLEPEGSPPGVSFPSFDLLNFRAGVETERWAVNVFVRNVMNEIVPFYVDGPLGSALVPPTQLYIGQPRTIGLSASVDF
jgi:outer membrane receptor protein involved in Fe transport